MRPSAAATARRTIPEISPFRDEDYYILGTRVDPLDYTEATELILSWAAGGESRYVCVANVHMIMEAYDDPAFKRVVNEADYVTADGMPLVWSLRAMGARSATRVYGPELTPRVCAAAASKGVKIGFFGASPEVRRTMVARLRTEYPALQVTYQDSPPFRPMTADEEDQVAAAINASGARIVFVGLGCPKQERWMARNVGRVNAVMLGVGAAFDFIAGTKPRSPALLQRLGLEWLFRMVNEPRRLWKRYLYHNPRFVAGMFRQWAGQWQRQKAGRH